MMIVFAMMFILDVIFKSENFILNAVISSFVGVLLSPRKKKITTQTGEKTQITWVFLKKPIFIDS